MTDLRHCAKDLKMDFKGEIDMATDEQERLEEIKRRLQSNEYFIHPLSDANAQKDLATLLSLIEEKSRKIQDLEAKNKILTNHAMELSQEIENIKSDFDPGMR